MKGCVLLANCFPVIKYCIYIVYIVYNCVYVFSVPMSFGDENTDIIITITIIFKMNIFKKSTAFIKDNNLCFVNINSTNSYQICIILQPKS